MTNGQRHKVGWEMEIRAKTGPSQPGPTLMTPFRRLPPTHHIFTLLLIRNGSVETWRHL